MADKRAADIIAKHRKRMDEWMSAPEGDDDEAEWRAITSEMQSDIANAINAAIAEVLAREPVEPAKPERAPVTHMPATGHDKPAARK
jgi:hypothetical protein